MEIEKQKKNKIKNMLLFGGIIALIFIVIITSVILNSKNKKLKKIQEENEMVKPGEAIVRIIN